MLILGVHELVPGLAGLVSKDVVVVAIKGYLVLGDVVKEFVGAEDLGDLDKLIIVVLALEERLLLEDHSGEHAS